MRLRAGVTLTEILIAAAILATLLVGVLNLFAVTQKQATSSEALLHSGTLAQLVMERVKSNVNQNPRYLRELMAGKPAWSFEGTVVDPAQSSSAGKLQLSPYFAYLFTRQSSDLCAPANQVAIAPAGGTAATATGIKPAELTALFESFRDYAVRVDIADDDVPLGTTLAPGPSGDAVKRVTVTVSRASYLSGGAGKDPLAYTVTSRLATPADSLTRESFQALADRFDGPPLEDQWNEYFALQGADNPYLDSTTLGDDSKKILADAFIITARANNESQLVDGTSVTGTEVVPPPDSSQKFIEPWITDLSTPGVYELSSSKRELAHLRARKSGLIFDTFKRVRLPMEHLLTSVMGPRSAPPPLRDKITSLTAMIKSYMAQIAAMEARVVAAEASYANAQSAANTATTTAEITAANAAQDTAVAQLQSVQDQLKTFSATATTAVQAERETVVLVSLLQQFFSDPIFAAVAARPGSYDSRLRDTLDRMAATLVAHLAQSDATPYERMAAAKMYYEVTEARELERDAADADAQNRIKALSAEFAPRMAELARYLAAGEVHDLAALKDRNARFVERVRQLHDLATRYREMVTFFAPGGAAEELITLYQNFAGKLNLDPKSLLGALGKMISQALAADAGRKTAPPKAPPKPPPPKKK